MTVDLFVGPNVRRMRELKRGRFDLAYLDPPFFTGKNFKTKDGVPAYQDQWATPAQYLQSIRETLLGVRNLMTPTGSVILHCDSKMNYRIRPLLDDVFGADHFASEIVWRYRRWPTKTPNFQKMHDTLYRYTMGDLKDATWNQLFEPLAESTRKTWGDSKQEAVMKDGKRQRSSKTQEKSQGAPMSDVWDIGIIAPVAKERTGYPTQKPEKLLERIISSMTKPGGWVLDPYCGSGTTLDVADRMGRNVVGIDFGVEAINTTTARLGNRLTTVNG